MTNKSTPWYERGTCDGSLICSLRDPNITICLVPDEEKAALIVSAVNSHAALMQCVEALAKLANEVLGTLPLMEALARREFGNTNYALLIQRAEEARAALSALEQAQGVQK